jgi:ABC-2 type transport system permease protein
VISFSKGIYLLSKKELKDNFLSPMVYILSALFCILMGWLFFNYLIASKELTDQTLTQSILLPIFGNMNFIFLFLAPILTMRSFAEERKLHTLELLLTSRLSHFQIILSKIIANFLTSAFMVLLTIVFPIVLAMSGYSHWSVVISSYVGVLLSILCYISVGCFASSLTENLVVSALLGFCILLGLMLFSLTGNATNNVLMAQLFQYLAIPFHFESFVRGGIRSFNIVYMFSFIGFFTYLTHLSLDSRRW